ncbi:MAG: hypothetical protein MUF42_09390 [Cytophagaceae bacterium]|jgi:hypothetical protein|nr:hypothetical protein [Cytophagaceae bacterium]
MQKIYMNIIFIWGMLLFIPGLAQPVREGAVTINSEGHYVQINHDGNGSLGIESVEFTVESWIYVTSNISNDFNFFRFVSGGKQLSVSYRGDGNKNSDPWGVDTQGLPEYGGGTKDANWYLSYKGGYTAPTFLNKWHHVAVVVGFNSTFSLYIDGQNAISTRLTKSGGNIASLFPYNGDGKCELGGTAINTGQKGTFYASEFRVWNTKLTASEISKYYDEEVNKSHPKWNNLIRYYHFTESSGTGSSRVFEDRSPVSEYDGRVSDASMGITTDQSPAIKPPAFTSNVFTTAFTASDCQLSSISLIWTNLRSGTFGYLNANDVWFQVRREDDNSEKHAGAANASSDAAVGEGDKKRYKLKTYWSVKGTLVYSDDEMWSDYGTIKMQYQAPIAINASTSSCDKSITLEWSAADGNPPYWTIERSTSASFASSITTMTSTLAGTNSTYTMANQPVETNLYYRVRASGNDVNGCLVGAVNSAIATGFTSKPPLAPSNMSLTQNLVTKTIHVTWTNPSGNNADSWIIKRKKFDGTDEVTFTTALGVTHFSDSDLQLCQTYSYSIAAVNECAAEGVYATTDLTGNVSTDLSNAISSMTATKGYLPDAVQLEWSLNGSLSNIDRFRIFRSRADQNNFSLLKILDNDLTYLDETAIGGVFYNYKVVGEAACESNTIYTNEGIDMGFVVPFGVANGHVEYAGGNPVENVTIDFTRQSGNSGHSLTFNGTSYITTGKSIRELGPSSFTMEAWIKTTCTRCGILGKSDLDNTWESGEKSFYLDISGRPSFVGNGSGYITGSVPVNDDNWHHIAVTWDKTGSKRAMYVDGAAVGLATATYSGSQSDAAFTFQLGRQNNPVSVTEALNHFTGEMDEIRIWNNSRSADQIKLNFNRVINGSEPGLLAYWRCDEGFGNKIFDASSSDNLFHKHDGTFFSNGVSFSTDIPSNNQLGIRGLTNEFGDYTIQYIPYKSGGEIFKVTPSLGQHAFQPSSRTVFIGDGAQTQNGLDFNDISSFTVTGKVTYYNSQVPVEGATILVDGKESIGIDNKVIRSDAEGNYSVKVPIGKHFISVKKEKHIFSQGHFPPLDAYGAITLHEFTENISVNFIDSTKIKVAGRLVGGNREGEKILGFDLSTNNVGTADLEFKLLKEGYDLDLSNPGIFDKISMSTDPVSGEYELWMIPEKWVVTKAGNAKYFVAPEDLSTIDLSGSLTPVTVSTVVNAVTSQYEYHHKLNFIIREKPSIQVSNADGSDFKGDHEIVIIDQATGIPDTLDILAGGYFDFPVFQMGKSYSARVSVFEYYANETHPNGAVIDRVPVKDAEVSIVNNLMVNPVPVSGKTDSKGEFLHPFKGGIPSLSSNGTNSYTQTMEVYVHVEGSQYTWTEDGEIYRAYVLGSKSQSGTDFITYGPEIPEMVLRDPPGSNSYAYIEKGSTFSSTSGYTMSTSSATSLDYTTSTGVRFGIGGSITGPLVESNYIQDAQYGIGITSEFNKEGNFTRTWSFNKRIATSADPEDVGADADLYIGKGTNFFMSKSHNLKILPRQYCINKGLTYYETNKPYVIAIMEGIVMDDQSTTFFVYSQKHILYELIPELINLRDRQFLKPQYVSMLLPSHKDFGLSNDDPDLSVPVSYTFTPSQVGEMDSVAFLNQQIGIWIGMIGINEMEKAKATVVDNISIDGSAGAFSNEITETRTSADQFKRFGSVKFYSNSQAGYLYSGAGFTMNYNSNADFGLTTSGSNAITNQIKFGYVIDEHDEGDYYSIDVKKSKGTVYGSVQEFSVSKENTEDWMSNQPALQYGFGAGSLVSSAGYFAAFKFFVGKSTEKVAANRSAYLGAAFFAIDMATHVTKLGLVASHHDVDNLSGLDFDVCGFSVSSPIFYTRGGQSRCPHEGINESLFYVNEQDRTVELSRATLQREVPVIEVEQSVQNNVPENDAAEFKIILKNESESNSNLWYDISLLESSNPNGAILLIDGLSPERSFLIPSGGSVVKTLTLRKGTNAVFEYDSIGLILHSPCQFDPSTVQHDIADTVYISARFIPACSKISLSSHQENWIINYESNQQTTVTLSGYNLNLSTLSRIDFQYKSLSGSTVTAMAWFKDTNSVAYTTYTGPKKQLSQSSSSFVWDVRDLSDRTYQLRARAVCMDGSVSETPFVTGIIDRISPTVFGTPSPGDGIWSPGENISITYNETLEAGLLRDHSVHVRSKLNGAAVSHGTSLRFNGSTQYARIPSVALRDKSFTIEFWLKREAGASGTVLAKGHEQEQLSFSFLADERIRIKIGEADFTVNPSPFYIGTHPVNAWHHWALSMNQESNVLSLMLDDIVVHSESDVSFNPNSADELYLARSVNADEYLAAQLHELRIWEKALLLSEVVSNMNASLGGSELGLYGYWPAEEGRGTLALDKTAGRHMQVVAQWELYPGSEAIQFNGSNQYLSLDGRNANINKDTDFTIEFWFKGTTPASTRTLFSSGRGDLSDTLAANAALALSIQVNSSGFLQVVSGGVIFPATSINYFDSNWHHFAWVVARNASSRSYVDGVLQKSSSPNSIQGLGGATVWLGARGFKTDPLTSSIDQYFQGSIDEFRIWNSARSMDFLNSYRNNKLQGTEEGLLLYYPFEEYTEVMGTLIRSSSLSDKATGPGLFPSNNALANGGPVFVSGATIRDVRPLQDIPFDLVINNDKIIITPLIEKNRIEGQILEIHVQDAYDLRGNKQLSPVSWTAYVEQNELVWQESSLHIQHTIGSSSTFTATLVNKGGQQYHYVLENLPAWLNTNASSGSISPNSSRQITFTVHEGLQPGYYEQGINLSTYLNFDEKLMVKVNALATPPDWTFDPGKFQYNMNFFGRLLIGQVPSSDVNDQVAAYAGNELRGVSKVQYIPQLDAYLTFITIYSHQQSGEKITFKVWDASQGKLYEEVSPELIFNANEIVGSSTNPQNIITGNGVAAKITLNPGWNWISFNLESQKLSNIDSLFNNLGTSGDLVKGQSAFDSYDPSIGWYGNLTFTNGIQVPEMYKVYLKNGGTLSYSGTPVNTAATTIPIKKGWNFLGYTPQVSMTVREALVGLQPASGDVIKSQNKFAMYDQVLGWIGSLQTLKPNEGYMLSFSSNTSFQYPEKGSLSMRVAEDQGNGIPQEWFHTMQHFADNMTIVAEVERAEYPLQTEDDILLVLAGDEPRGYANAYDPGTGKILYFLNIAGAGNSELRLAFYNKTSGTLRPCENVLRFQPNAIIGSTVSPYPLRLPAAGEKFGLESFLIIPNPCREDIHVYTGCTKATVHIYNALGIQVYGQECEELLHLTLPEFMLPGMYTISIQSECGTYSKPLIKY